MSAERCKEFAERNAGKTFTVTSGVHTGMTGRVIAWYNSAGHAQIVLEEDDGRIVRVGERDELFYHHVMPDDGTRRAGFRVSVEDLTPPVDQTRHPHACPRCRAPAYVGFTAAECSAGCGR